MKFGKQLPQGVADLYSNDYEKKEYVINQINHVTKLHGFKPIQTPTFEYYDLFMNMPGAIDTDQMIKLIDHDGKILVLRPDATIPIARMVANSKDPVQLEKLSYVTNIFRMQNGDSDVFSRSFTQLGVECFGHKNLYVDVEMILLAIESLKATGLQNFQIDLGQASFFQSVMNEVDLPSHVQREIQQKLEQKNEFELETVLTKNGIQDHIKQVLLKLTNLFGEPQEVIARAKELSFNQDMIDSIKDLEWVVGQLDQLKLSNFISVDLGLVNNLNYYTGIMFQGFVEDFGRSVIQGGRYDQLTEEFGLKVDAIGFGVYIDQLIDVLTKQGVKPVNEDLKVSVKSVDQMKSFELAHILREQGWIVDLFSIQDSSVIVDLDRNVIKHGSKEQPFHTQEDLISKVGEQRYGES